MPTLGVIGAGNWGSNWLRTLHELPGVELRWCCDARAASLATVEQRYPELRTTTCPAELLGDDGVDGVVIATSSATHFDIARRALQAGKHVLVEKPLTLARHTALALARLAQRQGRILMVGHLLEYHPAIEELHRLIQAGKLGEIQTLYTQRLNLGIVRSDENAWWSLAPHDIAMARRLLGGLPVSIQCRGQCVLQHDVEDTVFATLEFAGGRLAHVHVSWLDPLKTRRLVVVGTRRMAVFDDMLTEGKLQIVDACATRALDSGPNGFTTQRGATVIPVLETTPPLLREAQHFVDCIVNGSPPIADAASGIAVVTVLEGGQRSLDRHGSTISLGKSRRATNIAPVHQDH